MVTSEPGRAIFEVHHRPAVANGRDQQTFGVGRAGRNNDLEARYVRENRVHRLGVLCTCATAVARRTRPCAVRRPQHHEHIDLAAHHVVHLGRLVDDLVVADPDEVDEREIDDRTQSGHRGADGRADKAHLGDRGVDDPVLAELGWVWVSRRSAVWRLTVHRPSCA